MKVAVDARMVNMSGIGTYLQQLLQHKCYNIVIGDSKELDQYIKEKEISKVIKFDCPIYGIKEQLKFPYKELKKIQPDVLHIPHYNVPLFYRGKMVVTIHDLTHLIFPEFLPSKFAYLYAKFMIWFAVKRSSKIITDSENTKKDILKRYKVDPNKIEVIYLSAGDEFEKKAKEDIEYLYNKFNIPLDKKIIMYVGNLKPHKNLERLLEAFSILENKENYCLLLVGKSFSKYSILEEKEKSLNIQENVIHTGIVTQKELVDLYNLADLFVFPSLYEGFGIPVLEALSCETPVISSNSSSLKEVGGKFVNYFDPYNVEEIAKAISNNIDNKKDTKKMIENKSYSRTFDWNKTAQKTLEVIRNI